MIRVGWLSSLASIQRWNRLLEKDDGRKLVDAKSPGVLGFASLDKMHTEVIQVVVDCFQDLQDVLRLADVALVCKGTSQENSSYITLGSS